MKQSDCTIERNLSVETNQFHIVKTSNFLVKCEKENSFKCNLRF